MANKWLYPVLVGAAIAIATGLGGWNLLETASVPKIYSTKEEVTVKIDTFRKDHEERHRVFEDSIKNNFDKMFMIQRDMQKSLDDLNRKVD